MSDQKPTRFYDISSADWRYLLRDHKRVGGYHAVATGEFRAPQAGEWFLFGAIPEAYYASITLGSTSKYHIAKIVPTKTVTVITLREEEE